MSLGHRSYLHRRIARYQGNFVPGSDEDAEEFVIQTEAARKISLPMFYPRNYLKELHKNKLEEPPNMTEEYKRIHDEVL